MIDQVAAIGILQTWLDQRRSVLAAAARAESGADE
jgi:putative holliday junction resolvase